MTDMPFDINGNPDVMGSRVLTPSQVDTVNSIKADFNALHARLSGTPDTRGDADRLLAIARTQLELACMAAVKAISRS
jgi:hypothetical protein